MAWLLVLGGIALNALALLFAAAAAQSQMKHDPKDARTGAILSVLLMALSVGLLVAAGTVYGAVR